MDPILFSHSMWFPAFYWYCISLGGFINWYREKRSLSREELSAVHVSLRHNIVYLHQIMLYFRLNHRLIVPDITVIPIVCMFNCPTRCSMDSKHISHHKQMEKLFRETYKNQNERILTVPCTVSVYYFAAEHGNLPVNTDVGTVMCELLKRVVEMISAYYWDHEVVYGVPISPLEYTFFKQVTQMLAASVTTFRPEYANEIMSVLFNN